MTQSCFIETFKLGDYLIKCVKCGILVGHTFVFRGHVKFISLLHLLRGSFVVIADTISASEQVVNVL